jgi:alpha-beta hydrolase superfamily lysophospholipase
MAGAPERLAHPSDDDIRVDDDGGSPWVTDPVWFGPPGRPLAGWRTRPESGRGDVGVIVVPPLGYEYWTAHRTLRTLAERLGAQGCQVLRFDLAGTGDSAGGPADPEQLSAWRASVREAVSVLRGVGCTSLVVVGVRFGATLALLEGAAVEADRIVAWAPVDRGRTYVRELRLVARPIPDEVDGIGGGIVHAGSAFSPATLDDLRSVDLSTMTDRPAPHVLVVDRDDRPPSNALVDRLRALSTSVDHVVLADTELALDRPTEYSEVPDAVVQAICRWVGSGEPDNRAKTKPAGDGGPARFDGVAERVLWLGAARLVGVETEPDATRRATILWCNSGAEPHVGPGRAWVDYARALGAAGYASVRLDWSGWGESPDLGHAPGRPYDAHCIDEIVAVVTDLRQQGHQRIVVAGLCAGAWIALRAALVHPLDGIIAINPQLYWQPGDPVEANLATETRVRRTKEIRRLKRWRRSGIWYALDALSVRHPAACWLRDLEQSGTPILMLFAEGDDGLEFLEDRVGRSWERAQRRGSVTSRVLPGVDHPMHRTWLRPEVIAAMRQWLDANPHFPAVTTKDG